MFDICLVLLGSGLIITGLARFIKIYDAPFSIPQAIQSLLGIAFFVLGFLRKTTFLLREGKFDNQFKLLFAAFPFVAFSLFLIYRLQLEDLNSYARLVEEGSLVEWLSFLFLLLSAIVLFRTGKHNINKLANKYALSLGGLMFILSMEEVSWGQMIFNWQTPEFFDNFNAQQETNIHNLILLSGEPNTLIVTLVLILLTGFCLTNYCLRHKIKPNSILDITLPSFSLVGYFAIGAIIYFCLVLQQRGIYVPFVIAKDQELIECFFSLGILIHSCQIYLNWGKYSSSK